VGLRVGPRDLVLWSFLMASAHGAGLMLLPFLLGPAAGAAGASPLAHTVHAAGHVHPHVPDGGPLGAALARDATAVLVHTGAMLAAMTVVAALVYERLGVSVLRRAWVNLDVVWAAAVIVTGVFILFA
jgi:hypothetical protein